MRIDWPDRVLITGGIVLGVLFLPVDTQKAWTFFVVAYLIYRVGRIGG